MIPGTLRPLPKNLKDLKDAAEPVNKRVKDSVPTTEDIYNDREKYSYEEIFYHHKQMQNHTTKLRPLAAQTEKMASKYRNDELLRDLTFKLYKETTEAFTRAFKDTDRLNTLLMARKKKYVEDLIRKSKSAISSKLVPMKELSFDQIVSNRESYINIIDDITRNIDTIKSEYNTLLEGTMDVKDLYKNIAIKIDEIEEELKEFDVIISTCKMGQLCDDAEPLIKEGEVITKRFEEEQSVQLIQDSEKFIEQSGKVVKEMAKIKIALPKGSKQTQFYQNYEKLSERYKVDKTNMEHLNQEITKKHYLLSQHLSRVEALRENMGKEITLIESAQLLSIRRKGTYHRSLKEANFSHLRYKKHGEEVLVIFPSKDELTTDVYEQIMRNVEELEKTNIIKNYYDSFIVSKIGVKTVEIAKKIKAFTIKAYYKIKAFTIKAYYITKAFLIKIFNKLKELTKKLIAKMKKEEKEQVVSEEITVEKESKEKQEKSTISTSSKSATTEGSKKIDKTKSNSETKKEEPKDKPAPVKPIKPEKVESVKVEAKEEEEKEEPKDKPAPVKPKKKTSQKKTEPEKVETKEEEKEEPKDKPAPAKPKRKKTTKSQNNK